jgi:hypothetical protein
MSHANGRSASILWWAALCAVCACGGVRHPRPEPRPDDGAIAATACALGEPALRDADSVVIHFGASAATTREACALELVARELRPWPTTSNDRWAVRIALTGDGARAYRLRDEPARDAIDSGLALVVTEDVELRTYAASRPELEVTPLPWDHTYFWLARGSADSLGIASLPDAVRADARVSDVDSTCASAWPTAAPDSATPRSSRVVYAAGDRTAQELAERIVATAGGATVVAPLDAAALDAALRAGDELGYVVSLPRYAAFDCDSLAVLAQRVPWLAPRQVRPLIDTRAHAIVPRALRSPRP